MEVRAEGSRRGFSELGNEMKLTKRSFDSFGSTSNAPVQNRAARDGQGRQPREIASRASALRMSSLYAPYWTLRSFCRTRL